MTSPADRCAVVATELEAYHLGQLGDADAARVREHLARCPACAAALEVVRAVFSLADRIETIEPSPDFTTRLLARLETEGSPRSRPDRGAVAAALALLLYAGGRIRTSHRLRVGIAISVAAHAALLLLLTFVVLPASRPEPLRPFIHPGPAEIGSTKENLSPADGDGEIARAPLPPDVPEVPPDDFDGNLLPRELVERGWANPPREVDLDGGRWRTTVGRRWPTDAVAALVQGRIDPDLKERRVREAYGDVRPLAAIRDALGWLERTQREDGSWAAGEGYEGYREGVTGLALLAFLGDGHSAHRGSHRDTVAHGLAWLRGRQQEDGLLGDPAFDRPMYGHAIATLALLEGYVLDYEFLPWERQRVRRQIESAVRFIERAAKADGGWRYRPRQGEDDRSAGDVSVTLWQLMALDLARDAGFAVDRGVLARAGRFLAARTRATDGAVGYQEVPAAERPVDPTLTAGALAISDLLEVARETTAARRALVLRSIPAAGDERNPLLWYYASVGLRRSGAGEAELRGWTGFTTRVLLGTQGREGSWPVEIRYGQPGGPVYATALGALILESAYRLP